ncbi:MAG: STAS/SEC14 domain-containing protein [Balneolaceae bacterium]|nr:STAS/SEC14 domain-containing protein [Balneolaceae bacterium]
MITVQENYSDDILSIVVQGKLSEDDLSELVPHLKKHIENAEHPHLYMLLDNFGGYESASAFLKDLKLDAEYIGYFDRIAIVGDKEWEKWAVQVLDPITKEEMKFFSLDEKEQAKNWIEDLAHVE